MCQLHQLHQLRGLKWIARVKIKIACRNLFGSKGETSYIVAKLWNCETVKTVETAKTCETVKICETFIISLSIVSA